MTALTNISYSADGIAPFVSINAVTTPTTGLYVSFNACRQYSSMQVSYTGAPTTVTVNLLGTLDGQNWFQLAQYSGGSGESGKSGDIVWGTAMPVIAINAVLTTLSGGSAPTVTATLGAV